MNRLAHAAAWLRPRREALESRTSSYVPSTVHRQTCVHPCNRRLRKFVGATASPRAFVTGASLPADTRNYCLRCELQCSGERLQVIVMVAVSLTRSFGGWNAIVISRFLPKVRLCRK